MDDILKKIKRSRLLLLSLLLAALVIVLLLLILRSAPARLFAGRFGIGERAKAVDSFLYGEGSGEIFALCGSSLAVGSGKTAQLIGKDGSVIASADISMARPAADAGEKQAVFFDIGGRTVCVLRRDGSSVQFECGSTLLSADTGSGTNLAVVTEHEDYCGRVTVYNRELERLFSYDSGQSGYPVCARLLGEKTLLVCSVSAAGSVVRFFSIDRETELSSFPIPDTLILGADFLDDGTAAVLTEQQLLLFSPKGSLRGSYDFGTLFPDEYCLTGSFASLVLVNDYSSSDVQLITVDSKGQMLGSLKLRSVVKSLSCCDGALLVQYGDELSLFSPQLEDEVSYQSGPLLRAMLRKNDEAVLLSSYGARIFRFA